MSLFVPPPKNLIIVSIKCVFDLKHHLTSALFKKDASFTGYNALDGKQGAVSFQSVNYRSGSVFLSLVSTKICACMSIYSI